MLAQEFNWYKVNQAELVEKYNGKVVAIQKATVIGVFDSYVSGYQELIKDFEAGTFLLQKVSPGAKDYTQRFITRAVF